MGLKIGSSEYPSSSATFLGTKGVHVLQAGPSSNQKTPGEGLILLGQVQGCVGSAGSCLYPWTR